MLAALNRNQIMDATGARPPAPTISSSQQGAMTTMTHSAGASTVPPSTSVTHPGLSTTSSGEQRQSNGAATVSFSASAAVPGPSSLSSREQWQSSSTTMPQVPPHQAPVQGQSVRGVATGQSVPSSNGAQGASASSSQTRATKATDKVAATARQQLRTSRHFKKSQRGKHSPRAPPPPPLSGPPFPYDGDAQGMLETLHWRK